MMEIGRDQMKLLEGNLPQKANEVVVSEYFLSTYGNNANKYRNEQLPLAQAQADGIIKDAEAQKTERINEATAQVARFNAMYEEYIKNPTITKQRMFYEAMEEVLPDLKVVIESPNGNTQTFYPLESFTGTTTGSSTENSTPETAQ